MALAQSIGSAADSIKGFLGGQRPDEKDRAAQSDDGKVFSDLEERFKEAREDRRQYEPEWQTNLAFLKGQQWLKWDKVQQTLYAPPVPPWRVQLTTNLIQPVFRTIFGKITVQKSQVQVESANDTSDAQQDARAQNELLDFLYDKCNSDNRFQESLKWAIVTGTGLHHPCWDKSLGDALPETADETGQPVSPQEDNGTPVHLGEIDHISISPFEFFPEPLAETTEDMEWCFYVKVRPASYVLRKYGVKVDNASIAGSEYLAGIQNLAGEEATTIRGVLLKEYWERPNPTNANGKYVVYVDQKVLVNQDNPYPKEPIPFFEVKEAVVPGRFWGRSIITDLVPVQMNYNKARSQAVEIRNNTARPKWHVFAGALNPGETISTAPAEVIVTNPVPGVPGGGPPTKIAGGDVPPGFFKELGQSQTEFYEIAGLHDFSRGLAGLGGIRAAWALQMIVEQDDTRIGILKRAYDQSIVRSERAKLRLVKQFYIEPRSITIVGPDNVTEVKEFYGEKIPDDVNVRLITSGALPSSMAAKQQFILELWGQKLITDPRIALKLLEMGDVEGVYDDINRDIRQAQRENENMEDGELVHAHDYDNHLIHGQEHDARRKGEEYEELAAKNPQIAELYAAHVQEHKNLIQLAMQPPTPPGVNGLPAPQPIPIAQPVPLGHEFNVTTPPGAL